MHIVRVLWYLTVLSTWSQAKSPGDHQNTEKREHDSTKKPQNFTDANLNQFVETVYNRKIPKSGRYQPIWESLDRRPIPPWFDEAKVGVFIHWGVYSVPSFGVSHSDIGYGEYFLEEWKGRRNPDFIEFVNRTYGADFQYQDFADLWKAEFYNASQWADLVEESGAKYVVMTTKHHDGFTLWPSEHSKNWNSVEVGPGRDIIGEFVKAFQQKKGIRTGLYYSLYEWFNSLYLYDKAKHYRTQEFIDNHILPQMYDYVTRFKPSYIWSDGDWEANSDYWKSKEFLTWLYNDSPVKDEVVVNDRWGKDANCKHGGIMQCGSDRFNPKILQHFKWENAMTIDRYSWGFRRNAPLDDYLTMGNLTRILAETVSCGGNLLMNVGPAADGTIAPIFQERLRQMGVWLKYNGEAIYGTKPWRIQNATKDGEIWYTQKGVAVFAIVSYWPESRVLVLKHPLPSAITQVFLLGYLDELAWRPFGENGGLIISLEDVDFSRLKHRWSYCFKMTFVE